MILDAELSEQAGAEAYAKDIRGIARAVWQGIPIDAYFLMWDTVRLGITAAWEQGAASCGVTAEDLTIEERQRLSALITEQQSYIGGFVDWVYEHRRDGPDKLLFGTILDRAAVWANAWNRAYNEAASRACGDQKLRWVLHAKRVTKESCEDCLRLNGRIYRASVWAQYDIYPQSPNLACGGFRCGCGWEEVGPEERCTPGRPPRLSGHR